jgi:exodeoxyribonuclease III
VQVAAFNINKVNKRLANPLAWLDVSRPDVLCLRELKAAQTEFPAEALRQAGYEAVCCGQRSWNRVAILAESSLQC